MGLLLGIDAGTTSLKAGLFDDAGTELASAGREYRLRTPSPERVELDANLYWEATVDAVRRCLGEASSGPDAVRALALSSQGETLVPVSADGSPLGPAIVWLDNRATEEAELVRERFGEELVYRTTGVPALAPTWPACKLLWWRRREPELFHAAAHFLLVEEFLLQRLTGRLVAESGVQSSSLLLDITDGRWWEPMLSWLGLEPGLLGDLVRPGEVVGSLAPRAAEALGLSPGIPVVAGGMDQCAGAVGVGNVRPGMLSESTGGALTVQASVARPSADMQARTPVYLHSAPGLFLYCPVCPTGGMALTWFRDHFTAALGEPAPGGGGGAPYELLTELAAAVAPGADGLTVLPQLAGALSPEEEPAARGVIFGLTLAHGRPQLVRAILEGVAFMLRDNLELLRRLGAGAPELRSHGGGARSPLWCQIKADVCSIPVLTLVGSEAAVRGDAMLAGVAAGSFADLTEAAAAAVRVASRYEPDAGLRAAYDEAHRRYRDLFQAVRPLFRPAAELPPGMPGGEELARASQAGRR